MGCTCPCECNAGRAAGLTRPLPWQVRVESAKPMDLLVMENVFYERSLAPVYDLKGSERARWCKDDPADPTTVLLDENLKRDILSAPLLVRRPALSGASPLRKTPVLCGHPRRAQACCAWSLGWGDHAPRLHMAEGARIQSAALHA